MIRLITCSRFSRVISLELASGGSGQRPEAVNISLFSVTDADASNAVRHRIPGPTRSTEFPRSFHLSKRHRSYAHDMPFGLLLTDKILALNPLPPTPSTSEQTAIARIHPHNILHESPSPPLPIDGLPNILSSGSFPTENQPADDPNERIRAEMMSWKSSGRELLAQRLRDILQPGPSVWIRPRAGDAVGDIPSCFWFLSTFPQAQLFLDPAGMITHGMLNDALDHWTRIAEALGEHPGIAGILVANVHASGDTSRPCPIHRGVIDPAKLARVARATAAFARLAVVLDHDVPEQLARLRPA